MTPSAQVQTYKSTSGERRRETGARPAPPTPHRPTLSASLGPPTEDAPSHNCWIQASGWGSQRGGPQNLLEPYGRRVQPPAPLSWPRGSRVKLCPRASGSRMDPRIQEGGIGPRSAGGGVSEATTLALLLPGAGAKTKSREIQPQPMLAKAAYHRVASSGAGKESVPGVGTGRLGSLSPRRGGHCVQTRASPPAPALGAGADPGRGQTSFTCFLYIHGATSFLGLPVPLGGRHLPLREFLFFRPLTLALAPLVLQGLLPRHNQNPHVKGTAVARGPPSSLRMGCSWSW